ncbi:hypothetical protein Mettu_4367 [Methylobacter tundripaludum SV96]|uniref:Uncharacterized protein n=1 Tax=Methylobacter tundripaludum (strain ATCC BAA-1195 / DSM 17260 / SV96) TaxID=697282 RepID=G3IYI3_METTV|nr:hypothetical protein Mettu_4367 [Methylobacter tundripaludum SV96]
MLGWNSITPTCFLSKIIVVMGKSPQVDPNKTAKVKYLLNCPKITGETEYDHYYL